MLYGEQRFGEQYSQALEATGLSEETLKACQWVASRFPKVSRLTSLSFSHHQEVAALTPRIANELLRRAESDGLSTREVRVLARLEAMVERFRGSFVAAGQALRAIRDQKLYRGPFVTFEEYCRARWGFVRRQADRLIEAAEITEALGLRPIGLKPPSAESQARELARLDDPDDQAAAWTAALAPGGEHAAIKICGCTGFPLYKPWCI